MVLAIALFNYKYKHASHAVITQCHASTIIHERNSLGGKDLYLSLAISCTNTKLT